MKKNNDRYIKHVSLIPDDEFKKLGLFKSMMERFENHDGSKAKDSHMKMAYLDRDGELKELDIEELVTKKADFIDSWADGRVFCAVKILWSDGTWEYGLKRWNDVTRVYRKNCKLKPLYAKVGVINDETNEIEDVAAFDSDSRIPAWILELIPRYNEKIRDKVETYPPKNEIDQGGVTFDDWREVYKVMTSNYISTNAHWSKLNLGKITKGMAISPVFDRNKWWTPTMTTWKDTICKQEFGAVSELLELATVKVFCYSYVKSLYCDNWKKVREYQVIPISNILMLKKHKWNDAAHGWMDEEVWNNLDEACKGNV